MAAYHVVWECVVELAVARCASYGRNMWSCIMDTKTLYKVVGGDVFVYSEINTKTRSMLNQLPRSNKQLRQSIQ